MAKRHVGNIVILSLFVLDLLLWFIYQPADPGWGPDYAPGSSYYNERWIGEILGSMALIGFAVALILASRFRFLEDYFGGLDQMYMTHKKVAGTSLLLLLAHFFIVPQDPAFRWVWAPARYGMIAFLGILLLMFLTVAPRLPVITTVVMLPYSYWRILHKFMGLFFVFGILHSLGLRMIGVFEVLSIGGFELETVNPWMDQTPILSNFVRIIGYIGVLCWVYKQAIYPFSNKKVAYEVTELNKLTGNVMEIVMKAKGDPIEHKAGQFMFVSFDEVGMKEPHPFTIASAPGAEELRMTMKVSGDFTAKLFTELMPGTGARIHGVFGRFGYHSGRKKQVWIAAGIGLTPFLSFIREEKFEGHDVDFFYTTRSKEEALFLEEVENATGEHEKFTLRTRFTVEQGRLSTLALIEAIEDLQERDIYICGPYQMVHGMAKKLRKANVPRKQIHFEEFNFR